MPKYYWWLHLVNPIQDVGQKGPLPVFPYVTSTVVGVSPQSSLTFSFKLFAMLVKHLKAMPCGIPKLLRLNQDDTSKTDFSGQILIKRRGGGCYDIFSHGNARVAKIWSQDHIFRQVSSLKDMCDRF